MSDKLIFADAFREEMNEYILPLTENNLMGAADVYYRTVHLLEEAPAVDAVEVTYCDQCSNHGHCIPEDTFRLAGVEKPFCCVGGKGCKNAVHNGKGN